MSNDYSDFATPSDIGDFYQWTDRSGRKTGDMVQIKQYRTNIAFLSQGNPYKNGHYTDGGSFLSAKRFTNYGLSGEVTTYRPGFARIYRGNYVCPKPRNDAAAGWNSSYCKTEQVNLGSQGAKAWNRLRPDKPDFSFAASFYELKDVPGMLKDAVKGINNAVKNADKKRRSQGKSGLSKSGQFYLAVQFGWLPLLSDIQNFVKAHKNSQTRLTQLIRDNGKPIRRSTTMFDGPISEPTAQYFTDERGWGGDLMPVHVTQCYIYTAKTYTTERTSSYQKIWAEGQFRYHLPPGPRDVAWKKKMLRRIMGARVTPDVIYNIMPWSWLVDYFTDLGQFIQATSPGVADRLAADYAYVMKTLEWTHTREGKVVTQGSVTQDSLPVNVVASSTSVAVMKMRHRGSPFGWGFNQSSLTPKQWAILGALGLSKLP